MGRKAREGLYSFYSLTTTTTTLFYVSLDFVWDYPSETVPEETFTHSHHPDYELSPICPHLPSLSNPRTRQSPAQPPSKLPRSSTLHPTLHTPLYPTTVLPSQHRPTPLQPAPLQHRDHTIQPQSLPQFLYDITHTTILQLSGLCLGQPG